jgi:hypothetical protein
MKPNKIHIVVLIAATLFVASCKEQTAEPLFYDGTVPTALTEVSSESLPGSVRLKYKVPKDRNILYVMARCEINGKIREVKASGYVDNLLIEGFADTEPKDITLYTVSRSDVKSEPVSVKVTPLTPPYLSVFESIELVPDFGGVSVSFENPTEAELAIYIIHEDESGEWVVDETSYTKRKGGYFSARGFDPEEMKFGTIVKDRWDNYTDTLILSLTPFFEKKLDNKLFKDAKLPTDVPDAWGWLLPNIWDGVVQEPGFHTEIAPTGTPWPQYFTIDLGVEAVLSRIKMWQRLGYPYNYIWNDRNIRKFEVWGSNNPNPNGSFDESWTLLSECEMVKPSGLAMGENSAEDIQLALDGSEFIMPPSTPLSRFIRIKVTETWTRGENFFVLEFGFWGAEADELGMGNQ